MKMTNLYVAERQKKTTSLHFKSLTLLFSFLVFVFSACGADTDGTEGDFWAINPENNRLYQVAADMAAESDYCKIWVENGIDLDETTIQNIINEYEASIRPKMLTNFSISNSPGSIKDPETQEVVGDNILDYADYLTDGDGKLSILILDIPGGGDSAYVAGYFWSANFWAKETYAYSNECDLIYLNKRLLENNIPEFYTTFAHELQHLMNFSTSLYTRLIKDGNGDIVDFNEMDLWVNEGLSAAAEWVYSGQYNYDRLEWFNEMPWYEYASGPYAGKPVSRIAYGNNFFVWGERRSASDPDYILDEYATVYIFFQWLRLQTKPDGSGIGAGAEIYKDIIASEDYNHDAVVKAVIGKGNYYTSDYSLQWETLLRDWLAANVLANPDVTNTGKFSYMNDPILSDLDLVLFDVDGAEPNTGFTFYPGEGVYIFTASPYNIHSKYTNPSNGDNISRIAAGYSGNTPLINATTTFAPGALITYNRNTTRFDYTTTTPGLLEWGQLTSINYQGSPSYSIHDASKDTLPIITKSQTAMSQTGGKPRAIAADRLSKPQAVSMGDMLRKNGHKTDFGLKKSGHRKPFFKKTGKKSRQGK
ncbi:MAG: hypothetical protein FWG92_02180 [Leptospirales bacterium]|nr:hypothetical protein [Leptospirales bacterium]